MLRNTIYSGLLFGGSILLFALVLCLAKSPSGLLSLAHGSTTADFGHALANDRKGRIHALEADSTILFFNASDCPNCQRVKEYMAASPIMGQVEMSEGRAGRAIFVVYPDGDIPLWRWAEYPCRRCWIITPELNKDQLWILTD